MQRLTFCQDTYLDALTWTQDRRDAEMRGMCDFLRNNKIPGCLSIPFGHRRPPACSGWTRGRPLRTSLS